MASLYKVWYKEKKKVVSAGGLEELITKGKEKLGIGDSVSCHVALEDGTELDDDEALSFFSSKVLLLVADDEKACDVGAFPVYKSGDASVYQSRSPGGAGASGDATVYQGRSPGGAGTSGDASVYQGRSPGGAGTSGDASVYQGRSPEGAGTSGDASVYQGRSPEGAGARGGTVEGTSGAASTTRTPGATGDTDAGGHSIPPPGRIELPQFSPNIVMLLQQNDRSLSTLSAVLRESAQFYYFKYPSLNTSVYYQTIGEKLVRKYKVLAHDGPKPWSFICEKLSARIRQLRHKDAKKTKLEFTEEKPGESDPKKFRMESSKRYLSEKEFQDNIAEIQQVWADVGISGDGYSKLRLLMAHSCPNRRIWRSSKSMEEIVETFPCFQDGLFVCEELYGIISKETTEDTKKKLEDTIEDVATKARSFLKNMKIQPSGDPDIDLLLKMDDKVAIRKGKGKKSKSVIHIMKVDSVDLDAEEVFKGYLDKPLSLHFILLDGRYKMAYIVGEQVIIKHTGTVWYSILALLGGYYISDLQYPAIYGQLLGILQQLLLHDSYTLFKGTGFVTLYQALKD